MLKIVLLLISLHHVLSLPFKMITWYGQYVQPDQNPPSAGTWLRAQSSCTNCWWYMWDNRLLLVGYTNLNVDGYCTGCGNSGGCGGQYYMQNWYYNNNNQRFAIVGTSTPGYSMIVPAYGTSSCAMDVNGNSNNPTHAWSRYEGWNANQMIQISYLWCSGGTYWDGNDGHPWCNGCPSGNYCPAGGAIGAPYACGTGTYAPGGWYSTCLSCAAGTYTPYTGSTGCYSCPAGSYSYAGSSYCNTCPAGYACPSTSSAPYICPAGSYSTGSATSCTACPAGSYVGYNGATYCYTCPAGSYCPWGATYPSICPAGYIAQAGAPYCNICPAGTYLPPNDASRTACYDCPAGQYSSYASATVCTPCSAGYFSDGTISSQGIYSTSCKLCQSVVAGVSTTTANPTYHWIGGPLRAQCGCSAGWTGSNCEFSKCSDNLLGGSLGSLLLNADAKLTQFSSNYTNYNPLDVKRYLLNLLRVDVDVNGDGNITRSEMTTALANRQIFSTGMNSLKVWCKTASVGAYCYENFNDQVQVIDMFTDAYANFYYGSFHTFDASGVSDLTSLQSTFPSPTWNTSTCQAYDHSIYNTSIITTNWNINSNPYLKRVCGYVNGVLNADFSTSSILSGSQTYFLDKVPSSSAIRNKRVYCVAVEYCDSVPGTTVVNSICYAPCPAGSTTSFDKCTSGTGVVTTRTVVNTKAYYECSIGLIYNGAPVDLTPKLTQRGVTFSFMDTSTSEASFDIYVGELGSANTDKTHVVNIPNGLMGCGRISNPITFTDEISSMSVGQIMEYGISANQKWGNLTISPLAATEMTLFPYRIPFLVVISGTVAFKSGAGVEGVSVSICHVDRTTKKNDVRPEYCPIQTFVTDVFGAFSGEVRVSDPRWVNVIEYFTVTPTYVQPMSDGSFITHTFDAVPLLGLSHQIGSSVISITDTTETRIYGTTTFANVGSYNCPLPGVPVELTRDNGEKMSTVSAEDGTFDFTVTLGEPVQIRIPPFNGHTWSSSYTSLTGYTQRRRLQQDSDVPTLSPFTDIPTMTPSIAPTAVPTLRAFPTAELIHRFTFDDLYNLNNKLIPDVVADLEYGYLQNGLFIDDGHGVFIPNSNPKSQPYLQLGSGIFYDVDSFSIEIWASFASNVKDNAVLYSFGDPSNKIVFPCAGFAGQSNVYIVVVVNPTQGSFSTYINGTLSSTHPFANTPLLGGTGDTENFNYIGWDRQKTTPGFSGTIDDIKIWAGVLSNTSISAYYSSGLDPTLIKLTSKDTILATQITYLVTSRVNTTVGFFGGLSHNPMFGAESKFLITAVDPQCGWSLLVSLDPQTSTFNKVLAAMNYTVTLQPYATPLPTPAFKTKACATSLDPFTFLTNTNQLSTDIYVDLLETKKVFATFIYRSGVCLSVIGAENFVTTSLKGDASGIVCYANTTTMMKQGQNISLVVKLFELYPNGNSWITSRSVLNPYNASSFIDPLITDSMIEITDTVSGINSPQDFAYSDIPFDQAVTTADTPYPLNYTISALAPRPSPPYALPFNVYGRRNGPEGVSQVQFNSFVPVIGFIPSEVPSLFPVSTDPTLIFMVLRDPPGGNSFTTIHAGTTFGVAVQIDGMRTFEKAAFGNLEGGLALDAEEFALLAPLGIGVDHKFAKVEGKIGGKGTFQGPTVSASRLSSTHYEYGFNFGYDFSTSTDPNIAGHPSDIIIGGGVDVIVSQALEVYVNKSTSNATCLGGRVTPTWHPGAVTTFALPVIEIEILIKKLNDLVGITAANDTLTAGKLQAQLNNWVTVLANYRNYNTDKTAMFSADTLQFNDIITMYTAFLNGEKSADDFVSALETGGTYNFASFVDGGTSLTASYIKDLNGAYTRVRKTCDEVLPVSTGGYLDTICKDFDPSKWQSFASLILGACNIPESGVNKNPLSQSKLFQNMCKHSTPPAANTIPGGLTGSSSEETLFAFMQDNTKLITFGSNSPVQMSWTSTVTESTSFHTEFEVSKSVTSELVGEFKAIVMVAGPYLNGGGGDEHSFTLNLGKTADSSHTSERTVTVTLDDADSGDYFAVRITEDPVYATPIFTTMGGASKCPGESGTSRRESRVTIKEIRPRCGVTKNLPCTPANLNAGDPALFGVIIENLSPTSDEVYYTLQPKTFYDDFNTAGSGPSYNCGVNGAVSGLAFTFAETDLQRIPYNRWVEVAFSVNANDIPLCSTFNNIEVQIIATCEMPTSSSYVYQYGVKYDEATRTINTLYDEANRIYASNSTAKFSVSWPASRRRLDASSGDMHYALSSSQDREVSTQALKKLDRLEWIVIALLVILAIHAFISFSTHISRGKAVINPLASEQHAVHTSANNGAPLHQQHVDNKYAPMIL